MARQRSKNKHKNKQKSKRRWFPRSKPRGMTDAQAMWNRKEKERLESERAYKQADKNRQLQEATDRHVYHDLRCAEADRKHNSKSANLTGETTGLQPTSHVEFS